MRRNLFSFGLLLLVLVGIGGQVNGIDDGDLTRILQLLSQGLMYFSRLQDDGYEDLSILTFNIWAPVAVNRTSLRKTGNVDLNLVDTQVRLRAIVHYILETDPDLINLQEVQIDVYKYLQKAIGHVYDATQHAAHEPEHWQQHRDVYVENGVATFYRKDKFVALKSQRISNPNGNAALGNVLRMTSKYRGSEPGPLIILANGHFQHGFGIPDSFMRVSQGNSVISWMGKMKESLRAQFPSEEPLSFIAGDMNSIIGAPGVGNIKAKGYTNTREVTNDTDLTVHYPEIVITEILPPLLGLAIDAVWVANSDMKRVQIQSTTATDVHSYKYDEAVYVRRMMNIFLDELKEDKISKGEAVRVLRLLHSSLTDGRDYNTTFNRSVRGGSDHVGYLVKMKIKENM